MVSPSGDALKTKKVKNLKIIICLSVLLCSCNYSDPNVTKIDIKEIVLPHPDWSLIFNDHFDQIGIVNYKVESDKVLVFLEGCQVKSKMPFSYQYLKSKKEYYVEYSKADYMKLKECKDLKLVIWEITNGSGVTNI